MDNNKGLRNLEKGHLPVLGDPAASVGADAGRQTSSFQGRRSAGGLGAHSGPEQPEVPPSSALANGGAASLGIELERWGPGHSGRAGPQERRCVSVSLGATTLVSSCRSSRTGEAGTPVSKKHRRTFCSENTNKIQLQPLHFPLRGGPALDQALHAHAPPGLLNNRFSQTQSARGDTSWWENASTINRDQTDRTKTPRGSTKCNAT